MDPRESRRTPFDPGSLCFVSRRNRPGPSHFLTRWVVALRLCDGIPFLGGYTLLVQVASSPSLRLGHPEARRKPAYAQQTAPTVRPQEALPAKESAKRVRRCRVLGWGGWHWISPDALQRTLPRCAKGATNNNMRPYSVSLLGSR